MSKVYLLGLMSLSFLFTVAGRVQALSEFETTYSTTYQVQSSGMTTALLNISLTNKLSNVYADKFSLSVGFTDVEDIKIHDAVGVIDPDIIKTENQTTIRFKFIDRVVGRDKVNRFSVSYQTKDIAVKNGSSWEINIPQLETDKGVSDQKITLVVPSEFGSPAFITPEPDTATKNPPATNTSNSYGFEAKTLGNKAISAVFGLTQFMKFNLVYHLENTNPVRQKAEIALPPDTNYQRMIYESIQPDPEDVMVDVDGNWLAQYSLAPGEKLNINTVGVVMIDFSPRQSFISAEILQKNLLPSKYWQSNNQQIKTLASQLKTSEAIYDYVVDFLSYDYSRIQTGTERLGALSSIGQPSSAICTEFTDLFVTLNRAAGIPARELEGYAFTKNDKLRPLSLTQDVLHAWPEYFDKSRQKWIQVDPTWEDTTGGVDYFNKLDLNHFVFVIHGADPLMPLPAGAYKTEGGLNKDVKVIASDPVVIPNEDLKFEAKIKKSLWGGKLELSIKNAGMVSVTPKITIGSDPVDIIYLSKNVETIPPYGKRVLEVELPKKINLLAPKNLMVKYDQREVRVPIGTENDEDLPIKMATGGIVAGFLAICAFLARRVFVSR